jgi:hypothetical protein
VLAAASDLFYELFTLNDPKVVTKVGRFVNLFMQYTVPVPMETSAPQKVELEDAFKVILAYIYNN